MSVGVTTDKKQKKKNLKFYRKLFYLLNIFF